MSVVEAILLGIIQGVTEFLPISSSGHLAIGNWLFGTLPDPDEFLTFNVLVHFASVAAILIALRKDIYALLTTRRYLILPLVIGTIPAGLAGIAFKSHLSGLQTNMPAVGGALMFTGIILALSERLSRKTRNLTAVRPLDAIAIGTAQAIALVPGVSRSGMTISGGLFRGLTREDCVRFSFMLAIPAILGATALEARKMFAMASGDQAGILPLILGGLSSLIFSFAAIELLLGIVRRYSIAIFSYYCVPVGALVFLFTAPPLLAGGLASILGSATASVAAYAIALIIAGLVAWLVFFTLLKKQTVEAPE